LSFELKNMMDVIYEIFMQYAIDDGWKVDKFASFQVYKLVKAVGGRGSVPVYPCRCGFIKPSSFPDREDGFIALLTGGRGMNSPSGYSAPLGRIET
jgi:hypothetical protein